MSFVICAHSKYYINLLLVVSASNVRLVLGWFVDVSTSEYDYSIARHRFTDLFKRIILNLVYTQW